MAVYEIWGVSKNFVGFTGQRNCC